jgi:hypothetical protein
MIGKAISHYRVLHELRSGGLWGAVFQAEELRLGCHVALKFVPASLFTVALLFAQIRLR